MFSINQKSEVVIYGAATSGQIIYDIISKRLHVVAFIDKRADEIGELRGKRVVKNIEDIEEINVSETVIIIAVKNVFEHSNIAAKLLRSNIHNILYKPLSVLQGMGTDNENKISTCYDFLLKNKIEMLVDIPATFQVVDYMFRDYALIKKEEGKIWAYVPACMIYTNKSSVKHSIWENIPILALRPHIDLFQAFLSDNSTGVEAYVDFCCEAAKNVGNFKITDRWKENVISNRLDVFRNMDSAYELDKDFFIRNAPSAEWNDNGYFNLLGGKHRAAFLVAKGNQYIALQISKDDYKRWINYEKEMEIKEYMGNELKAGRKGLVEHPFFYRFPFDGGRFISKVWIYILRFLTAYSYEMNHNFQLNNMKIFVAYDDMGYIARNFKRLGAEVYEKLGIDMVEEKISELMNLKINKKSDCDDREVDVAVLENEVCREARFCFVISELDPCIFQKENGGKLLFHGSISGKRKYLYLVEK